jgi:hypothetical protein
MTEGRLPLNELLQKAGDGDFGVLCRKQRRAAATTMLSPKSSTSLQGRDHPLARALAVIRSCRVRDAGVGGLFNNRRLLEPIGSIPPAEPRTLLCHGATRNGGVTQTKQPPANPARFMVSSGRRSLMREQKAVFKLVRKAAAGFALHSRRTDAAVDY